VLRCYGVVSAGWIWARRARICRRRCHMPPVLEVGNVLRCFGVLSAGWIWARRARICRRRRHMPPRRPWTRFGGDVGSGTMTAHAGVWCEWWWRGPCVRVCWCGAAGDGETEATDVVSVWARSGPGGPRSGGALRSLKARALRVGMCLCSPSACGRSAFHLCTWTSLGVNATDLRGITDMGFGRNPCLVLPAPMRRRLWVSPLLLEGR
jgi:hypothetical protein